MDATSLLSFLLIGLAAGWLAGKVMGGGLGIIGNIVVGVIGSYLGGYLFQLAGISGSGGLIGSLVTATAGAVVLLILISLVKKA